MVGRDVVIKLSNVARNGRTFDKFSETDLQKFRKITIVEEVRLETCYDHQSGNNMSPNPRPS